MNDITLTPQTPICEIAEIIICDETDSDYPLFTRYDPLLEW